LLRAYANRDDKQWDIRVFDKEASKAVTIAIVSIIYSNSASNLNVIPAAEPESPNR